MGVIKAAGASVEPFWPGLFASALSGVDVAGLSPTSVPELVPPQLVVPPPVVPLPMLPQLKKPRKKNPKKKNPTPIWDLISLVKTFWERKDEKVQKNLCFLFELRKK